MKLIVGLGNKGKEYERTRHNAGFMAIDEIIKNYNLTFDKEKFDGLYCDLKIQNEKIIFLKPQKYMNLSGEVIKKFVDFYKVEIDDILIINDDLDLPLGKIKIKSKGSSGGHNGLKNIEKCLGTKEYKRLKIGISNNKNVNTIDYVIGKMPLDEHLKLMETIKLMPDIFNDYMNLTFDNLMNKYN